MKKKLLSYITLSLFNHIDNMLENRDKEYLQKKTSLGLTNEQELLTCKKSLQKLVKLSAKKPQRNLVKDWVKSANHIEYETYDLVPFTKVFTKRLLDFYYQTDASKKALSDEVLSVNFKIHKLDLSQTIKNESKMREILREIVFEFDSESWDEVSNQSTFIQMTLINYFENIFDKQRDELKVLNTQLEQKVEQKSKELFDTLYYDNLTKLPNINAFLKDTVKSEKKHLALFNIDGFRKVNSIYGHEFGNEVLKEIVKKIDKILVKNPEFKLYRYHGDWFIILQTQQESKNQLEDVYKEILETFDKQIIEVDTTSLSVSFTAGLVNGCSEAVTFAELAYQKAKENKNSYEIYNEDMDVLEGYKKHEFALNLVKYAIDKDLVFPYFQLIRDNKNPHLKKYESLMRIEDPYGNVFSPFVFLDVAKDAKLYCSLSKIMMRKSIEVFKDVDASFSINLEADDVLNPLIMEYLYTLIVEHKVQDKIILEITESQSIEDFKEISKIFQRFKDLGVKVAIDDFGTGYSNFSYLVDFDFDFIKIDGSLIKNIHVEKNSYIVTSMIVDFAKKLGKKVIAEFIDKEEVQQVIQELDIDYSQGYLFSKPSFKLI